MSVIFNQKQMDRSRTHTLSSASNTVYSIKIISSLGRVMQNINIGHFPFSEYEFSENAFTVNSYSQKLKFTYISVLYDSLKSYKTNFA